MSRDPRYDSLSRRFDNLLADQAVSRKEINELRQQPAISAPASVVAPKEESWIKKHSGWFTVAAFVLGSGFILKVADGWIDSRISVSMKEPLGKIGEQGQDLSEIKGQLKEISGLLHIVVQKQLKSVATLPQAEFNRRLDEVKTVLAVARSQEVKAPDENVTESIRSKIADSDEDLDQYWGAAAAVVNYESASSTPSLPDCLSSPPKEKLFPNAFKLGEKKMTYSQPFTYSNCQIELDEPRAGALYAQVLTGGAALRFYECVIRYRGRPVIIPPARYTLHGELQFIDCIFDLEIPQSRPPKLGELLIAKAIRASSISNVVFEPAF